MASVQAIISSVTGFKSGSRVAVMALVENKTVRGMIKKQGYKYEGGSCLYGAGSEQTEIIDVTNWNLKWLVSADVPELINFGCIQTWGCTAGGTTSCTSWDSAAGSFKWAIPIVAENKTAPGSVPGFTVTPSNGGISFTWGAVADPGGPPEVFAYDIYVYDGAALVAGGFADAGQRNVTIGGLTNGKTYTVKIRAVSHNGIPGAYASTTAIPVGATYPQVYNIFTTPDAPASGVSVTITAQLANTGPAGKVRAVFKAGGTQISDQNSTLNPYPGGGLWSPTATYIMPSSTITLTVDAYGWDGTKWVLTDTKSITRTPSATPCSGITLTPFSASIKQGDKVTFTATATPATQAFPVKFKDNAGNVIGSCTTSGGICTFIWDSAGKTAGTYYVQATVEGQCTSTTATIQVAAPILQWNLSISALDYTTGKPIQGATVVAGTQTKLTDINGLAQFRVDQGTVSISISAAGYNTFTTVESVYSDRTLNYPLTSTAPTTGSIMFVSVPSNAGIFIDGADQGARTPIQIFNIPAGKHTFTLKLAGFNDTTGEVTVTGGGTVQAYATLSPLSPTTGSLSFFSTPPGAVIFIDGTDQGVRTPSTLTGLTAGTHDVKLTLAGYLDWIGTVTVTAGQTAYLNPALTLLGTIGAFEISSIPAGARVFIDGVDTQKITPATITNLASGEHTFRLALPGYSDASGKFMIEAGQTTPVSVTLNKTTSIGALLAVVAIGTGIAVLASVAG